MNSFRKNVVRDLSEWHGNRFVNDHPHDQGWDGYEYIARKAIERNMNAIGRDEFLEFYGL